MTKQLIVKMTTVRRHAAKKSYAMAGALLLFVVMISLLAGSATAAGPAPVNLGTVGNFAILSKAGITDVPTSIIIGNIGASPITGAAIGMPCSEVTGTIYSVDAAGPACEVIDSALLTTAVLDMQTAYTNVAGQSATPANTNIGNGNIGGLIFYPAVYNWGSAVTIPTSITLDCQGNSSAIFVFQVSGTLDTATSTQVNLINGCLPQNIFWQTSGQVTLGATSIFEGTILSQTGIAMLNGATLNGRALAQTAVTLIGDAVTAPAGSGTALQGSQLIILSPNPVNVLDIQSGTTVPFSVVQSGTMVPLSAANIGTVVGGTAPYSYTWELGISPSCYSDTEQIPNAISSTLTMNIINGPSAENFEYICFKVDSIGNYVYAPSVRINIGLAIAPVISGTPSNIVATATTVSGSTASWPAPTATDQNGASVPVTCASTGGLLTSGSTFPVGVTAETCSATDVYGNTGMTSFTVTITSPTLALGSPPIIVPGSIDVGQSEIITANIMSGTGPYTYSWTLQGAPVVGTSNEINYYGIAPGVGTINVIVTDATGATVGGSGTVTVNPLPAFSCGLGSTQLSIVSDANTMANGPDTSGNWQNSTLTYNSDSYWIAIIPGASWIWDNYSVSNSLIDQTVQFTRTFDVPGNVVSAYLTMATDNNGVFAVNSNSMPSWNTTSNYNIPLPPIFNITNSVYSGNNLIAFSVLNIGMGSSWNTNPAGLLYNLTLCYQPLIGTTPTVTTPSTPSNGGGASTAGGVGGFGGSGRPVVIASNSAAVNVVVTTTVPTATVKTTTIAPASTTTVVSTTTVAPTPPPSSFGAPSSGNKLFLWAAVLVGGILVALFVYNSFFLNKKRHQ
jgi:hypothetical protein